MAWCQKYGLKLILDIHKAPGFSFTYTLQEETKHLNTLFDDAAMQERFIHLWEFMAKRYRSYREMLVFELMNELVVPDSEPWNDLAGKLIAAIRVIDPERDILVGGNYFNSVNELKISAVLMTLMCITLSIIMVRMFSPIRKPIGRISCTPLTRRLNIRVRWKGWRRFWWSIRNLLNLPG